MLVDAAVHASGASKKLISPFIPASAAKREIYEIRAVDKEYRRKETKQKQYRQTISLQKKGTSS